MRGQLVFGAILAGLVSLAPAQAGATSFTIVNAAGADIESLALRRVGSTTWQPLGVAAAVGRAAPVPFNHDDCAFDVRATLAGGVTVTWPGVNLCDVKIVRLHRNAAGLVWVDYD